MGTSASGGKSTIASIIGTVNIVVQGGESMASDLSQKIKDVIRQASIEAAQELEYKSNGIYRQNRRRVLSRLRQRNCLISSKDKTVIVSATMDLTDSYSISVSTNQIENGNGLNITDHAHPSPETLSLTCILSNDDFDYTNPLNLIYDTAEQAKEILIEFAKSAKQVGS